MTWTEKDARWLFSEDPTWEGRRASNWQPAQALIAALDQERARVAKLERVRTAARARLHMWTRETYVALVEALEASDE